MTKKRTARTINSFVDNNEPSEDLILADLDLMREDWQLAPVSLADVMDDHHIVASEEFVMPVDYDPMTSGTTSFDNNTNNLTSTVGLDSDKKQNITNTDVLAHLNFTEERKTFDQAGVEPIILDIITTEVTAHNNIESIESPINDPFEKPLAEDPSELIDLDIPIEATLASEQANASIKAIIAHYDRKVNRSVLISYAALGLSLSAIVAIAFLITLIFNTKNSNTKLTESVSMLQEDVRDLTIKYEDLDNSSKDVSIDSFNQPAIKNTTEATNSITGPTKNKIIHAIVNSSPLKKVDLQSPQLKHPSIALDVNKKNKAH